MIVLIYLFILFKVVFYHHRLVHVNVDIPLSDVFLVYVFYHNLLYIILFHILHFKLIYFY